MMEPVETKTSIRKLIVGRRLLSKSDTRSRAGGSQLSLRWSKIFRKKDLQETGSEFQKFISLWLVAVRLGIL